MILRALEIGYFTSNSVDIKADLHFVKECTCMYMYNNLKKLHSDYLNTLEILSASINVSLKMPPVL